MGTELPGRVNVLGVGVHATNMKQAVRALISRADEKGKGYVCVTGVHGVMESQNSEELREIHNRSLLTVPDGMPMVWVEASRSAQNVESLWSRFDVGSLRGNAKNWAYAFFMGARKA